MRKLASIQIITDIRAIPNSDNIDVAIVKGWHVVVQKGKHKIGDKIVYIEIDSLLPENNPEFEFLKKSNYIIKTARFRGQISQGIIFPLSILPPKEYNEDDDVSDILNIKKYQPKDNVSYEDAFYMKKPKVFFKYIPKFIIKSLIYCNKKVSTKLLYNIYIASDFPYFAHKTDEIRIQNMVTMLPEYENKHCIATEKLDGTSATYYLKDGNFGICSHVADITVFPDSIYHEIARKFDIENKLRKYFKTSDIVIQGEIIGPGVHGNKYNIKEIDFYIFSLYNISTDEYYTILESKKIAEKIDLKFVPIVYDNFVLPNDIDDIVGLSEGKSNINKKIDREGIVVRLLFDENIMFEPEHLKLKIINTNFLLKYSE